MLGTNHLCILLLVLSYIGSTLGFIGVPQQETGEKWWKNVGKRQLRSAIRNEKNDNIAKNIILFVGNGLDTTTLNAARVYLKVKFNLTVPGENFNLIFEAFDNFALLKTESLEKQVPGRSSAATALLNGIKSNENTLRVNGRVAKGDCTTSQSEQVLSIVRQCIDAGKAAGIVTTGRLTQGVAAASYAYAADDSWEASVPTGVTCPDIASQLDSSFSAVFGGGRASFNSSRTDGADLIQNLIDSGMTYVTTKAEMDAATISEPVLGLFAEDAMDFTLEKGADMPSLSEMAVKAVRVLDGKSENGFILVVEAANIRRAHASGQAEYAMEETLELNKAILELSISIDRTDFSNTLMIMAGDSGQVLSYNGGGKRGNPVTEPMDEFVNYDDFSATDGKPMAVLTYANGPGYAAPRDNVTGTLTSQNAVFPSGVPMTAATGTASDVPVYAFGPMSHLFQGRQEQSYVANVMAYAACIGEFNGNCPRSY